MGAIVLASALGTYVMYRGEGHRRLALTYRGEGHRRVSLPCGGEGHRRLAYGQGAGGGTDPIVSISRIQIKKEFMCLCFLCGLTFQASVVSVFRSSRFVQFEVCAVRGLCSSKGSVCLCSCFLYLS